MEGVKEEVSKNLLYYRKRKKLTQKALAEELGVSHNTISQWESGTNTIDIDTLHKACTILGVSVNDMYGAYANALTERYSPDEKKLLDDYQSLSEQGKEFIRQTMFAAVTTYKKDNSLSDMEAPAKLG